MRIFFSMLFIIVVLAGGFYAYKEYTTLTISELNENARKHDGETVTVEGIVTQNASILGAGGFLLSDGSSSILVLSNGGIPQHEISVEVTGVFRKAVSLNSFEYSVIYQE